MGTVQARLQVHHLWRSLGNRGSTMNTLAAIDPDALHVTVYSDSVNRTRDVVIERFTVSFWNNTSISLSRLFLGRYEDGWLSVRWPAIWRPLSAIFPSDADETVNFQVDRFTH